MKPWPTQSQHDPILSSKGHNDSRYIWTMSLVKEVTPVETDYSGAVSIYMLTQSFNIVITTNKMIFTSILKEMEAAYMTKWLDSTRTEWELVFCLLGGGAVLWLWNQPGEDIIVWAMVTLFESIFSISVVLFPFLLIWEHLQINKQSVTGQLISTLF